MTMPPVAITHATASTALGAGLAACGRLHDARQAWLNEVLGDWPADRVDAFTGLFEQFNSSVEAHLRTDPAATPRENA